MDPVIEEIPVKIDNVSKKITKFYEDILETCTNVGAVKPNYAFFAQYGFPGLRALKKIIDMSRKKKLPVILDAKRGRHRKKFRGIRKGGFRILEGRRSYRKPIHGKGQRAAVH